MSLILRPRDRISAFFTFVDLPFYSFKDFILNKDVTLSDAEVCQVERNPDTKKATRLFYSKDGFTGSVSLEKHFKECNYDNIKFVLNKRSSRDELKEILSVVFNWHSPFIWGYLFQVSSGFLLIEIMGRFKYGFNVLNQSIPGCDKECMGKAYCVVGSTYIVTYIAVVPVLIFINCNPRILDQKKAREVTPGLIMITSCEGFHENKWGG
jgi:hypothetical protein